MKSEKQKTTKIQCSNRHRPVALVDACDDWVLNHNWRVDSKGYVYRRHNRCHIQLHREILGRECEGLLVDHINHDPLDNRRCNLRAVTPSQNQQNRRGVARNNKLGLRGVYLVKSTGKYEAHARLHGKRYTAGWHSTPSQAAEAAQELRRRLGFIENVASFPSEARRPPARVPPARLILVSECRDRRVYNNVKAYPAVAFLNRKDGTDAGTEQTKG